MTIKYARTVPAKKQHLFTISYGQIKHVLMNEIKNEKRFADLAKSVNLDTKHTDMDVDGSSGERVPANFSITITIDELADE